MEVYGSILSTKYVLTLEQLQEFFLLEDSSESITELTRRFCLQSSSQDIQKKGMEFLYIHGYFDDLKVLIKKNKESEHFSNNQWADIYQIMMDLKKNRELAFTILPRLNQLKTSDPELVCLIELAKASCYYYMNRVDKLGYILATYQQLFSAIDDRLLVSYFRTRIRQISIIYFLKRNEMITARKFGYQILNEMLNPFIHADIHIKLGLSYTFESLEQGMYHLSEALRISKEYQFDKAVNLIEQRNIPFLLAHFNQVENISTQDKSEQAHIEIAKGNNGKAIEILNELPLNTPFQIYYLGKAKQDKQLLIKSYLYFIEKQGDHFFSKLPLYELKQLNS
ncbi:hypothetical protein CWR45_04840 [Oceanobacillus chungangensis]|uniref:Uncharacterized protein n=1 Tax=Oceanobacillus chungangensis TaxID=1229152 RepID=A0A3D8Q0Q1_9BACI|nr:hypothetical protein CWR45_04840 [Oceanobacillus chungangensis]